MITYFVLSHLLKVILRKVSDFQRESTKERNKNETCDHTYLARLARATIHKNGTLSRKWLLWGRVCGHAGGAPVAPLPPAGPRTGRGGRGGGPAFVTWRWTCVELADLQYTVTVDAACHLTLSPNTIIATVLVSDCWYLFRCVFWSFFLQNTDVISTDILAFLVEKLIQIQSHINSPLPMVVR